MLNAQQNAVVFRANAKVNLFLHVKNKDEKGYHLLNTVFQPLDLSDRIIIREGRSGIKITSDKPIPLDKSNSVYKAIQKICERTSLKFECLNYEIHIEKNIPIASGLGGSAVDAAPVIRFINERFKLGLSEDELDEIGATVGADVPQAMYSCTTYAERYGDKIKEKYHLPKRYVSLYIPTGYMAEYPSKTATLYNMIDEIKKEYGENLDKALMAKLCLMKKALKSGDWKRIGELAHNDFEFVAFKLYPILHKVKEVYKKSGAECALLAGSGGTVFGVYKTPQDSVYASNRIEELVGKGNGLIILTETL
ncbi:MAG: 4-(cytidine 5'-diphospho)-2-C-methyl-D-erythritol kinase [Candidatus Micrarchaeota archaeon]|nr:4-(cytidine 5'-diphospho)-2-C-methyl-D-erythritol kinase [Candidatus Micrarchaeota archaeon]